MKNQQRFKKIGLLSLLLVSATTFTHAQLWTQQTVPTLPLRDTVNEPTGFGCSVSISSDGNWALIGATDTNIGNQSFQGKAYFYKRVGNTWVQKQAIKEKNGRYRDNFGYSTFLSADGKVAVIGAKYYTTSILNEGAAFVYTLSGDTLVQRARLSDINGRTDDAFSESIGASADGSTIVIGASNKPYRVGSSSIVRRGLGFVYKRVDTTWQLTQYLFTSSTDNYELGYSISVSADGNTILMGAPNARDANNNAIGRACVFTFNSSSGQYEEQTPLPVIDSVKFSAIGLNVCLSADGKTAAVSGLALKQSGSNLYKGKIYVFTNSNNTWSLQDKITASDIVETDWYGHNKGLSISGDGRTIIVGAAGKDMSAFNSGYGKSYIYARTGNGWVEQAGIYPNIGRNVGSFGNSVSLSYDGNIALVGAGAWASLVQGNAFVFIRNPNATTETNKKSNVILYPSIVKDELYIKTDGLTTIAEVQIANTVGQIVYTQKNLTENALHLQGLPSGLYVVSVRDTEGGISTGKIIKN